ncbi:helix-turn-helix domain containing protein [Paenibacillus aurantiacus]|uniref:Helix-turn-helix domain containing protein n=1 Tax=Paenibacillus aurantiacus TaxID=1936118 RepID=A0ABV5KP33_9BACL
MRKKRINTYIACEDLNHVWDESEVIAFDQMWCEGLCIYEIAEAFQRDPDEVAILAIDRACKRMIKPRGTGALGATQKGQKKWA